MRTPVPRWRCQGHRRGAGKRLGQGKFAFLLALALSFFELLAFAASQHHGQVTFGGLPVPGVTVTATHNDKRFVAITDQQGSYTFAALDEGVWTFQVEMQGFEMQTRETAIGADTPSDVWELKLLPIDQIANIVVPDSAESAPATGLPALPGGNNSTNPAQPAPKPKGFERAVVNSSTNAPPTPPPSDANATTNENSNDPNQSAATGLLVNGSVNNGGASAFAQAAAFGNNRRGQGSLYNGGAGIIFDTSSWDATPVLAKRNRHPQANLQQCADRKRARRTTRTATSPDQQFKLLRRLSAPSE